MKDCLCLDKSWYDKENGILHLKLGEEDWAIGGFITSGNMSTQIEVLNNRIDEIENRVNVLETDSATKNELNIVDNKLTNLSNLIKTDYATKDELKETNNDLANTKDELKETNNDLANTKDEVKDLEKASLTSVTINEGTVSIKDNNADIELPKLYNPTYYKVNANPNDSTLGSVYGGGTFLEKTSTTLYAQENNTNHGHFLYWADNNKSENPRDLSINKDENIQAVYGVDVTVEGKVKGTTAEDVTVKLFKADGTEITDGKAMLGDVIKVVATTTTGYHFVGWADGEIAETLTTALLENGKETTREVKLTKDNVIDYKYTTTGIFAENNYKLHIHESNEQGGLSMDINASELPNGINFIYNATPTEENTTFAYWSDDYTNTENPRTITSDYIKENGEIYPIFNTKIIEKKYNLVKESSEINTDDTYVIACYSASTTPRQYIMIGETTGTSTATTAQTWINKAIISNSDLTKDYILEEDLEKIGNEKYKIKFEVDNYDKKYYDININGNYLTAAKSNTSADLYLSTNTEITSENQKQVQASISIDSKNNVKITFESITATTTASTTASTRYIQYNSGNTATATSGFRTYKGTQIDVQLYKQVAGGEKIVTGTTTGYLDITTELPYETVLPINGLGYGSKLEDGKSVEWKSEFINEDYSGKTSNIDRHHDIIIYGNTDINTKVIVNGGLNYLFKSVDYQLYETITPGITCINKADDFSKTNEHIGDSRVNGNILQYSGYTKELEYKDLFETEDELLNITKISLLASIDKKKGNGIFRIDILDDENNVIESQEQALYIGATVNSGTSEEYTIIKGEGNILRNVNFTFENKISGKIKVSLNKTEEVGINSSSIWLQSMTVFEEPA